ncbi:MAG: 4-oxalocrotonate tautomerase [Burkholderiaceae bacterium]
MPPKPCRTPCRRGASQPKEFHMPSIHVEMFEGRTPEQKRNLVKAITQAVVDTLGGKAESVDIILTDIKRENWATGGELWSEKK